MSANHRTSDGYVRIPVSQLPLLRLTHVITSVDPTIAVPDALAAAARNGEVITGFTEWVGKWGSEDVTMGWDWCSYGGAISPLEAAELRTNILLTADGVAYSSLMTRMLLWDWTNTIAWRDPVMQVLQAQRDELS